MSFASWKFAFFFLPVFGLYWAIPARRGRHLLLLSASYFFYMAWNPWLVTLLLFSTVLDYFVAIGMERSRRQGTRQMLLAATLIGNLGLLAVFKYADFFILSFQALVESLGMHAGISTLSILLPVGISFYTFQTLSYTIDVYRREIPACRSFIDFALFVSFFPQLVAGPIVKAREFLPQLSDIKRFDWSRIDSGVVLFMIGLTKKLLIADNLATLVDPVFSDPSRYGTRDLWLAMFAYGGQIYCDFSGYTDMAIAIARMMGFDFSPNFASPYLAVSLTDFWRRWHISLSTWLRDYLYIPLGGSRLGTLMTARNLMITMLLGGLWHGASWTFVIWGAIHGSALVLTKGLLRGRGRSGEACLESSRASDSIGLGLANSRKPLGAVLFGWATTLLIVHIAWVFFRCQPVVMHDGLIRESTADALARATYFVTHLFVLAQPANPAWLLNKRPAVILLVILAILHVYEEWTRRGKPGLRLPAPVAGMGYAMWIVALVLLSPDNASPFIYFQF